MRRSLLVLVAALAVVLCVAPGALAGSWRFAPTINAPWAGETDSALDTPLQAVGLCRSAPWDTLSAYAATSNVDMILGDPINNSGASNFGCSTPQNETTVAVNPTNPNNVVAGANDYRVCCDFTSLNDGTGWAYSSFDGGATWRNVQVPGLTAETGGSGNFQRVDAAGDPSLAFGPDGTLYYANIVFSRTSFASGVAVSISHDGGVSWSAPNMVSYVDAGNHFNDKEWIAAGPNGQVVVTWTSFNLGPHAAGYLESPIVAAFSKDGGKTWNRQGWPVSDDAHPFDQGSFPQFGPDGTLYVAYEGGTPSSAYSQDATIVARSTDGGSSFSNTEVGRVYDDNNCYPVFAGRQTLTGEHFRLNSYPSLSVDPVTGRLAIVWADNQGVGTCGTGATSFAGTTAAQVKLVSGAWGSLSAPTTITHGADKVFPAVAARGGVIAVSYYTRDYAATHNPATCNVAIGSTAAGPHPIAVSSSVCLDYASSSSTSGFAETRLTTEGSNPYVQFANGAFIGDYSEIALGSDGVAHPVWTDFRGRPGVTAANQDIYTQSFRP